MYSWWNAIPCGLDRASTTTAADKAKGRGYLSRAIALHERLYVVVAVGAVAHDVVSGVRTDATMCKVRIPLRTSADDRDGIRRTLNQGRLFAYPLGPARDA